MFVCAALLVAYTREHLRFYFVLDYISYTASNVWRIIVKPDNLLTK